MIELKGVLKSISTLDTNVFILTTESGKHIGDLTIIDSSMLDKIEEAFLSKGRATGEIKTGEKRRTPISLPINLTIKVRQ